MTKVSCPSSASSSAATGAFGGVRLRRAHAKEHRCERRHEQQRDRERSGQREHDREGHRTEHLPLDTLQREDRDVDDDDDAYGECDRSRDLEGGVPDHIHPRAACVLPHAEMANEVLDHDHAAVDDQAEIDGPQAHEVSGDPSVEHPREGDHHRERDGRGDKKPSSQVPEEQQQHRNDQQGPLGQVCRDSAYGLSDQVRPVVESVDDHTGRKRLLDLLDPVLDPIDDLPGVLSQKHHHDARDGLASSVTGHGPLPHHGSEAHRRDVRDVDRRAILASVHDDALDIAQVLDEAFPPDVDSLASSLDVGAAGVGVVLFERLDDLVDPEPVAAQLVGIELNFVRLEEPPERVDLDDARHGAQLVCDLPVEDRSEVHERVRPAGLRVDGARCGPDLKLVDLSEPRGDRSHLDIRESLRDRLAG